MKRIFSIGKKEVAEQEMSVEGRAKGGGGPLSWMSVRRKSKDVMGYKGVGFTGAVEQDREEEGERREREPSSGASGTGRREWEQEQQEGVITLGARIGGVGAVAGVEREIG